MAKVDIGMKTRLQRGLKPRQSSPGKIRVIHRNEDPTSEGIETSRRAGSRRAKFVIGMKTRLQRGLKRKGKGNGIGGR